MDNSIQNKWRTEVPRYDLRNIAGYDDLVKVLTEQASIIEKNGGGKFYVLYGPPGCGKTYFANAFIGELAKQGYSFLKCGFADLISSIKGETEKNIDAIANEAIACSLSVVMFEDIDSICAKSSVQPMQSITEAFDKAIQMMLASGKDIVVIGITNIPETIDPSVLKRASFIAVSCPDSEAREKMWRNKYGAVENDVDCKVLADRTFGLTARQVETLAVKTILAIREKALEEGGETIDDANKSLRANATDVYNILDEMLRDIKRISDAVERAKFFENQLSEMGIVPLLGIQDER